MLHRKKFIIILFLILIEFISVIKVYALRIHFTWEKISREIQRIVKSKYKQFELFDERNFEMFYKYLMHV